MNRKQAVLVLILIPLLGAGLYLAYAYARPASTSDQTADGGSTFSGTENIFSKVFEKVTGSSSSAPLIPPQIPASGLYLGARVNPEDAKGNVNDAPGAKQIAQLEAFNRSIGRTLAFHPVFIRFGDPIPQESLIAIDENGSIPAVQLACFNVEEVVSGTYDARLAQEALALKEFGKPVFLRWYWEMNKASAGDVERGCNAAGNGAAFILAWQHIWQIFRDTGATNVAFIWSPSAGSKYTADYYPGDTYVDWIAGDGFFRNKNNQNEFDEIFGNFYRQWVGRGKPIMIGATGAEAENQVAYFTELRERLPTQYPQIKAMNYFNAVGTNGDFTLQGQGLEAFKRMANDPYFTYR